MKNMFGEEVDPETLKLTFTREYPHLMLRRNKKFIGMVSPNGWTNKSIMLAYPKGEPVLSNYFGELSLSEMAEIMQEYTCMQRDNKE